VLLEVTAWQLCYIGETWPLPALKHPLLKVVSMALEVEGLTNA
jgi:hypothetical protein